MHTLLDYIMRRRAAQLAHTLAPHLPAQGIVLDVGAGTGHNSHALRRHTALTVVDADVVQMRVLPGDAVLYDGLRLPFADNTFTAALLVFVLHYVTNPVVLLCEVGRVTRGAVLLLQTTYRGRVGARVARGYDYLWGPAAFQVARWLRWVPATNHAMTAHQFYTRPHLAAVAQQAGFVAHHVAVLPWGGVPVAYDLLRLEPLALAKDDPCNHHRVSR